MSGSRSYAVRIAAGALAALTALCTISAQPDDDIGALVDRPESLDALRNELADTTMVARNNPLAPCVSSDVRAFSETRPIDVGMWAGRFDVTSPGQGDWFLVVRGSGDATPWRQRLSAAGQTFTTPVAIGTNVDISLEGPGQANQACPDVIMRAELHGGRAATPRGVVGPDDRWEPMAPQLLALSDSATIAPWSRSIVHLQIFDAQRGLPCTGFFVTAHLVMTARHCVMSVDEAANTSLELGSAVIRDLRLLMSQSGLDFSLLWVNAPTPPAPLPIRSTPAPSLVLWQSPVAGQQLVSVIDCQPTAGAAGRFFHQCDTSVGTSGAPIQDRASGTVVALHTTGCTISGDPNCVNFGTPIAAIRARLADRLPALERFDPIAAAELRAILN